MSFDGASDYCWTPDVPVQREEEWRLDVAQFGDGYAQRIMDGINPLMQKWQVTFSNRPKDVLVAMLDYLYASKGNSFQFLEPATHVMYHVWCDKWTIDWTIRRPGPAGPVTALWYGTLQAEFVRAYGVTG